MNSLLIAIDPGRAGAIAAQYPTSIATWRMPNTDIDLLNLLRELATQAQREGWVVQAFVEKVGGYVGGAGQPGSAMFTFGRGYGFIIGTIMALEVPLILVTPQQWQGALQLGKAAAHGSKPAWKRHLRAEATRRFPALKPTLSTADALLMLAAAPLISPRSCDRGDCKENESETKQ